MNKEVVIKLIGESWFELIGEEFSKPYMITLGNIIRDERKEYKIYPENPIDVFSVFRNLPPEDINVLIMAQDPYHDGSYDGRAFSNRSDSLKISPSLRNILKEVENDMYDGMYDTIDIDPCLERWEKQGVFLINRVLTVREGKPNSHANIGWEYFTGKVISLLTENYPNIVFMLWGKKSQEIKKYISNIDDHYILEATHPSPLGANQGGWFGSNHFSKANKYLVSKHKKEIVW